MPSDKVTDTKPQIPIVLAVIKNNENQLLIGRRSDVSVPASHEKWELVGGKIEWQESPEQALIREVKEETGLDIEIVRLLPKIFPNYWTKKDGTEYKVLLISYECKVTGGELHTNEFDHKIAELKFIDFADLNKYEFLPIDPDIIKLAYS